MLAGMSVEAQDLMAEKMRRERESSAKAAGQPSLPSVSGVKGDRVLAEDTKAFPTLGPA